MKSSAPRFTRELVVLIAATGLFAGTGFAQTRAQGPEAGEHRAQMQAQHEARRAEMLARLDSDGNGSISAAEIDAAAATHAAAVDANGDGRIAAAEIQAFREAKRAEASERRAQKRMQQVDANADGSLSTEEFAAAHAQRLQRMDRNGDGVIEADEFGGAHRGGHRHRRGQGG